MPEELLPTTFGPLVDTEFVVDLGRATAVTLVLTSCDLLTGGDIGPRREPFSLLFRGPILPVLSQGTYAMDHRELGRLEIFIVPLRPESSGAPLYEAVFN